MCSSFVDVYSTIVNTYTESQPAQASIGICNMCISYWSIQTSQTTSRYGQARAEGIQVELNSHDPHDHNFSHDPKNLHDQINVYLKISPPFKH